MKYRVRSSLITPDKSTRVMGKGRTKGWGRGLADRTGTKIQRKSISSEDGKFGVSGRQELEKIKLLHASEHWRVPTPGRAASSSVHTKQRLRLSPTPDSPHSASLPWRQAREGCLETLARGARRVPQHSLHTASAVSS